MVLLLQFIIPVGNAQSNSGEQQIKVAMIYNMAKFTEWPPESLPADQNQFLICILGQGQLGRAVETLQSKQVRGRSISIRSISQPEEAANCQILVIAESERQHIAASLERTRQDKLMTVSDSDEFAKAGGSVGFYVEDGKVRLEINTSSLQLHKVRIDAQVLKLARIVQVQL